MVDRIRYPTVSYLPFYYIFFSDWLSIFIINNFLFTSQNIGDKWHTLKPGAPPNDRGGREQTTVPGSAQMTLTTLTKWQFGGLERHLWHTLELGRLGSAV